MSHYPTPRCPKCKSLDVFRTWNAKHRRDDGFCRKKGCNHKSDFDDFLATGEAYDCPERDFDKDKYYTRKQAV